VGKTTVICVTFLHEVAGQKLLKWANVSRRYSKNNTGTGFLRHGVCAYLVYVRLFVVLWWWMIAT